MNSVPPCGFTAPSMEADGGDRLSPTAPLVSANATISSSNNTAGQGLDVNRTNEKEAESVTAAAAASMMESLSATGVTAVGAAVSNDNNGSSTTSTSTATLPDPLGLANLKLGAAAAPTTILPLLGISSATAAAAAADQKQETSRNSNKVSISEQQDDSSRLQQQQANDGNVVMMRNTHRRSSLHLHQPTVDILLQYLKSQAQSTTTNYTTVLDEDQVAIQAIELHSMVQDRLRFRLGYHNNNDIEDSHDDDDDHDEGPYQEEVNFVQLQDFFKDTLAQINASSSILDKRTMNWFRKSLGLYKRRNDLLDTSSGTARLLQQQSREQTDESQNESDTSGADRMTTNQSSSSSVRVTRRMIQTTKNKKREERQERENEGLTALLAAVDDLEVELGLFRKTSKKKSIGSKRRMSLLDDLQKPSPATKNSSASKPKQKRQKTKKSRLSKYDLSGLIRISKWKRHDEVATQGLDRKLEIHISSVIVDGINVEPQLRRLAKLADKKQQKKKTKDVLTKPEKKTDDAQQQPRRRVYKKRKPSPVKKQKLDTDEVNLYDSSYQSEEEVPDRKRRKYNRKAGKCQEADMEAKEPSWEQINPLDGVLIQAPGSCPPRKMHSKREYATMCARLINSLNASTRAFARYEFFYSDIDRAWFNFDEFRDDIAKLGVPPDVKFTRTQWSLIRRQIRKRPRRFSAKFVKEKIDKLNEYRGIVKNVQHYGLKRPVGFQFEVPKPIEVGATVTAYNARFRVVHRGMVLGHDLKRGYLVQFERGNFGTRYVPDFDVASHGEQPLLETCDNVAIDGSSIGGFGEDFERPGTLAGGTRYATDNDTWQEEAVTFSQSTAKDEIEVEVERPLVEHVAEREVVVKLITSIEMCMQRKQMLLNAIDELNGMIASATRSFNEHYSWLVANLTTVTKSLDAALAHLQVLYGQCYDPNPSHLASAGELQSQAVLDQLTSALNGVSEANPSLYEPFVHSLVANSEKVASDLLGRASLPDQNNSLMTTNTGEAPIDLANSLLELTAVAPSAPTVSASHRSGYMNQRLQSAAQLLLCAQYGDLVPPAFHQLPGSGAALNSALEVAMHNLSEPAPLPRHHALYQASMERESALQELRASVTNLQSEIAFLKDRR